MRKSSIDGFQIHIHWWNTPACVEYARRLGKFVKPKKKVALDESNPPDDRFVLYKSCVTCSLARCLRTYKRLETIIPLVQLHNDNVLGLTIAEVPPIFIYVRQVSDHPKPTISVQVPCSF